jgi:hypothetical protein
MAGRSIFDVVQESQAVMKETNRQCIKVMEDRPSAAILLNGPNACAENFEING